MYFLDYGRALRSRMVSAVAQNATSHQNWSLKRLTLCNPSKSNSNSVDLFEQYLQGEKDGHQSCPGKLYLTRYKRRCCLNRPLKRYYPSPE